MGEENDLTIILVKIEGLRKDVGHITKHMENHTPQIYANQEKITILETNQSFIKKVSSTVAVLLLSIIGKLFYNHFHN